MKFSLIVLCSAVGLLGVQAAFAQNQQQQQMPALVSIMGQPFSGTRVWQGARNFIGGNRVDTGTTERLYRDGQGRTRVEHEVPPEMLANRPNMEAVQITINDPLSGDRIELHARTKTAMVMHGRSTPAVAPSKTAPPVSVMFAGHAYTGAAQGWSKPVALGQKSFDGLSATGQRRQLTVPVGTIGNEQPIVVTVDQWFSPDLSLIVARSAKTTLSGEVSMEIENVVRGEPNAALFLIPPDYKRIDVPPPQASAH